MKHYKASWSTALVVTTFFTVVLCFGIAFGVSYLPAPKHSNDLVLWLRWLPLACLPIAVFFTIRGYSISSDEILVHRLFWSTRLPRKGLLSAQYEPNAMSKSIRTCGNGGCFSFSGFYRSKTLGSYRAFVTDLKSTVVLRYDGRTIVVSPSEPEDFIQTLTPKS